MQMYGIQSVRCAMVAPTTAAGDFSGPGQMVRLPVAAIAPLQPVIRSSVGRQAMTQSSEGLLQLAQSLGAGVGVQATANDDVAQLTGEGLHCLFQLLQRKRNRAWRWDAGCGCGLQWLDYGRARYQSPFPALDRVGLQRHGFHPGPPLPCKALSNDELREFHGDIVVGGFVRALCLHAMNSSPFSKLIRLDRLLA